MCNAIVTILFALFAQRYAKGLASNYVNDDQAFIDKFACRMIESLVSELFDWPRKPLAAHVDVDVSNITLAQAGIPSAETSARAAQRYKISGWITPRLLTRDLPRNIIDESIEIDQLLRSESNKAQWVGIAGGKEESNFIQTVVGHVVNSPQVQMGRPVAIRKRRTPQTSDADDPLSEAMDKKERSTEEEKLDYVFDKLAVAVAQSDRSYDDEALRSIARFLLSLDGSYNATASRERERRQLLQRLALDRQLEIEQKNLSAAFTKRMAEMGGSVAVTSKQAITGLNPTERLKIRAGKARRWWKNANNNQRLGMVAGTLLLTMFAYITVGSRLGLVGRV